MKEQELQAEFCVIGGGLAGLSAAVTAARQGVRTVLVQDRPVLGGNASSEIRMWICGSDSFMESGFVEELRLANFGCNPNSNYRIWDTVLYGKASTEPNLTLLLNASCLDAAMDGQKIRSVRVWQLTTYTFYNIQAEYFADCSGDSILAEPTGAEFRVGHEARSEFNESIAPPEQNRKTMGMSCLIQAREMSTPQTFTPPDWAYTYETDEDLPPRGHSLSFLQNYWWLELGGEDDSIHDTEKIRDELLKIALGVWDHIKNHGDHNADNWTLDWIGFLPGKRESRRYIGDHVLTQNDVNSGGRFEDMVAYGGWPMDDHHPAGFRYNGPANINYSAPGDFGIPYRALYSRNIGNLWFAGRNISVTHVALSSTRVMATCACMGEAVGMAAAVAVREKLSPRETGRRFIREIQQRLLWNDCYLPGIPFRNPRLTREASLQVSRGNGQVLRGEAIRGEEIRWTASAGDWAEYSLPEPAMVQEVRLVLDSDLEGRVKPPMRYNMLAHYPLHYERKVLPASLPRSFRITAEDENGQQILLEESHDNCRRLVIVPVHRRCRRIRLEILDTVPRKVIGFRIRGELDEPWKEP